MRLTHLSVAYLLQILGQRKRLLQYMYDNDKQGFAKLVRELGIRNPIKSVVLGKTL